MAASLWRLMTALVPGLEFVHGVCWQPYPPWQCFSPGGWVQILDWDYWGLDSTAAYYAWANYHSRLERLAVVLGRTGQPEVEVWVDRPFRPLAPAVLKLGRTDPVPAQANGEVPFGCSGSVASCTGGG